MYLSVARDQKGETAQKPTNTKTTYNKKTTKLGHEIKRNVYVNPNITFYFLFIFLTLPVQYLLFSYPELSHEEFHFW